MTTNGIIQRKLELIDSNTRRLRALLPVSTEQLRNDFFLKNGIERTLQISIEAMLDIAHRSISLKGQAPATDSFQALQRLAELGMIRQAEAYRNMVRFRNFMVHRYEYIEPENIAGILSRNLGDFDRFIEEISSCPL